MFLEIFRQLHARRCSGRTPSTSTTSSADRLPVPGVPARRGALPAAVPAHPGRRVPRHQPRAVRADPRADRGRSSPSTSPERHAACVLRCATAAAIPGASLTVVGDSDQSIYAFRGADIRNISEFERDFPNSKVILLEQNYRSTQNILDAANAVISNNFDRKAKNLSPTVGAGEKIVGFTGYSGHDEAQFVADEIEALHEQRHGLQRHGRVLPHQLADPCAGRDLHPLGASRTASSAAPSSTSAPRSRTRWRTSSQVANPADDLALRRIMNVPQARHRAGDRDGAAGATPTGTRCRCATRCATPASSASGRRSPAAILESRRRCSTRCTATAGDARPSRHPDRAPRRAPATSRRCARRGDPQDEARAENLDELVARDQGVPQQQPRGHAHRLPHRGRAGRRGRRPRRHDGTVSLMTLHTAKGLEYDAVFLTGVEEDLLPHRMSASEPGGPAEERRLFYVGITRARKRLYLSLAMTRCAVRRDQRRDAEPVPARDPGRADRLAAVARRWRTRAAGTQPRALNARRDGRLGDSAGGSRGRGAASAAAARPRHRGRDDESKTEWANRGHRHGARQRRPDARGGRPHPARRLRRGPRDRRHRRGREAHRRGAVRHRRAARSC